jgi:ABC-type siderophore export system fused ATPase/permease subunit
MSLFLKRDQRSSEKYALQDAVINLKHAISMEIFNFSVKKWVPITLSSLVEILCWINELNYLNLIFLIKFMGRF